MSLLDVLKCDVTRFCIIITATYRGHLEWLFYIFGKAKLMGGDLMISPSCQKQDRFTGPITIIRVYVMMYQVIDI
jgi:hypothetical protein